MFDFKSKVPSREKCIYTAYYCEENVWHLCQLLTREATSEFKCYCVFISNPSKAVHLWKQKLCGDDSSVIWDYHVIAVYGCEKYGFCALDLDTTLPFPVSFKEYVKKAIRSENNENNIFRRYFRVIPAEEFLKHFSSDRRHMRVGDAWLKPPPKYPPLIIDKEHPHNLEEFVNMEHGKGYGEILSCEEFMKRFSS